MDNINLQPVVKNVNRTTTVEIPGKEYITQPYLQEYYQQNDIHHVQNPIYEKKEENRYVPVLSAVKKTVPVIRRVPIPVKNEEDGSYTHYTQIGKPAHMTTVSIDYDCTSEEEGHQHKKDKFVEVKNYKTKETKQDVASWINGDDKNI